MLASKSIRGFVFVVFAILGIASLQGEAKASPVPEFELNDIDGNTHNLKVYAGKMVILNYWATWCPPCREELPELSVFHENHHDKDAMVLGVDFEDIPEDKLREFLDEQLIDYPIMQVKPSPYTPFGVLLGLPTSYLISADRSQYRSHIGPLTTEQLEKYLEELGPQK